MTEGPELIRRLDKMLVDGAFENEEEFTNLFDEITGHFNQYMNEFEDVDGITNLALLDQKLTEGIKMLYFH